MYCAYIHGAFVYVSYLTTGTEQPKVQGVVGRVWRCWSDDGRCNY